MPDATRPMPPHDWRDAFAALPLEPPPADGWSRVAARLDARRRRNLPLWLATAAALVLAVALPWQLQRGPAPAPERGATNAPATIAATDPLQALYAESARLETLLQLARDERVSSGHRGGARRRTRRPRGQHRRRADAAGAAAQTSSWRCGSDRVDALRSVAGFEGTRRWLVANGSRYDGALVRID